jgi:hypothetical protein
VKAVFSNARVRADFFRTMFPVALTDWNRWIGDREIRGKIDDFVDRYPSTGPIETAQAYVHALEVAAVDVLERNYRGAEIREMNASSMISLWIADGREAVLAIRTFAARNDSHAFATSDPQLVKALATIHAEYMAQAEPHHSSLSRGGLHEAGDRGAAQPGGRVEPVVPGPDRGGSRGVTRSTNGA